MQSLHQRATLDANRIEPPPAPLPDPDVVYDHLLGLVSLARALKPDLPADIRFVRHAPLDEADRNTASFKVMFTSDTTPLSEGGYQDANARELWEVLEELMPADMVKAEQDNLASSPRFRFASAADAAIYSALKRTRISIETQVISDDKVIQVSNAVRAPEMAFQNTPTLARWVYLAPARADESDLQPHLASWRRDVQHVRRVLKQDFSACSSGDRDELVSAMGRLSVRKVGNFEADHNHGWLGYSLAQGASGWTQFLLNNGASPYAAYQSIAPIAWAIARDEPAAVRELCAQGVTPSAILTAAPQVLKAPEQNELAARVGGFPQLLIYAAGMGATRSMAALLDAGADISAANARGASALHVAAASGYEPAVRLLIGRGANLEQNDQTNHLPSEYVSPDNDALFELMEAVRLGNQKPAVSQVPTISEHRAQKSTDAYGEAHSMWDETTAPPRPRIS